MSEFYNFFVDSSFVCLSIHSRPKIDTFLTILTLHRVWPKGSQSFGVVKGIFASY